MNVVPDPVLDTRSGDAVAADAIAALPDELSDRSDSNPAVSIIEALASVYDKAIYQINRWPRALTQKLLAVAGIRLLSASPATCTQQFTLSSPQRTDTVIDAFTEVATQDSTIGFKTLSDLTITAYTTPTGTVSTTSGSATVTGSGTTFVTGSTWEGWQIQIPANTGNWYTILSVASTTSLTVTTTIDTTVSGQAWNVGAVSGTTTVQANEGGASTNVGAGKLITLVSSPANVVSTTNTTDASGGSDEETAAEAVVRGPTEYGARDVACSDEDYQLFSEKILGDNSRCRARGGYNGTTAAEGYVSVALLSPAWTTSSSVSAVERAAVARDLASRSQSGVTVVDVAATITDLTASGSIPAAVVYRKTQYDSSSVRIAMAQVVNTHYSPNTYPFGRDRYIADLSQVVESATGVDRIVTINGVPAVGTNYQTAAAAMTFASGSASVTAVGAADYAAATANQTFLIDSANNAAYLITAKSGGNAFTISSVWGGSSGATSSVPFFTAADVSATNWYTTFYANLGVTSSTLSASLIVTGVAT
jgi:hypothetical protein